MRGLLARLGLNDRFLRLGKEEETSGLESGVLAVLEGTVDSVSVSVSVSGEVRK